MGSDEAERSAESADMNHADANTLGHSSEPGDGDHRQPHDPIGKMDMVAVCVVEWSPSFVNEVAASDASGPCNGADDAPDRTVTAPVEAQSIRVVPSVPPCAEGEIRSGSNEKATTADHTIGLEQPSPWRTLGGEAGALVRRLERKRQGKGPAKLAARSIRQAAGRDLYTPCLIGQVNRLTVVIVSIAQTQRRIEGNAVQNQPIIEPAIVPEVYVTGILIDSEGVCVRITFYSEQYSWSTEMTERVVAAKLVATRANVSNMMEVVRASLPEATPMAAMI